MFLEFFILIIAASFTGIFSGLLGIGGGLISVPVLAYFFQINPNINISPADYMHFAVGTSLSIMAIMTPYSAFIHYKKGMFNIIAIKKLLGITVVFCIIGATIASFLNSDFITSLYIILLIFMVKKMLQPKLKNKVEISHNFKGYKNAGVLAGLQGGMLGGGGSLIITPFLVGHGLNIKDAKGSSTFISSPLSLIGAISYIVLGVIDHKSISLSFGFVYWPATLIFAFFTILFLSVGIRISQSLKSFTIQKIFICLLLFLIIKLSFVIF